MGLRRGSLVEMDTVASQKVHRSTHPSTYSLTHPSTICLSNHAPTIQLSIYHSLINPPIHPSTIHSSLRSPIHIPSTHPPTYSSIHPPAYPITNSSLHSSIHPPIHSTTISKHLLLANILQGTRNATGSKAKSLSSWS